MTAFSPSEGLNDVADLEQDDRIIAKRFHNIVANSIPSFMKRMVEEASTLELINKSSTKDSITILNQVDGKYYVMFSSDKNKQNSDASFFFEDESRVFFVEKSSSTWRGFIYTGPRENESSFGAAGVEANLNVSPKLVAPEDGRKSANFVGQRAATFSDVNQKSIIPHSNASQSVGLDSDFQFAEIVGANEPAIDGMLTHDILDGIDIYNFTTFYHPYSCLFIKQLSRYGVEGLLKADFDSGGDSLEIYRQLTPNNTFDFEGTYDPVVVSQPYPVEEIDFNYGAPYAIYNWEVFFHAPLLIATRLMQDQKFEEAQRWFHYIFNPMARDGTGSERFWSFRPFFEMQQAINVGEIDDLVLMASEGDRDLSAQIIEWQDNPFNPHAIARMRTIAYMRNTVMKYLDNLLAWADMLFARDTMESIAEATQIYVLAADIMGPRPVVFDGAGSAETDRPTAQELLNELDYQFALFVPESAANTSYTPSGESVLNTLLAFCIPLNDKLFEYWDTIADRLFKVRHCMNIEGVVRQLPLYEPPIDPALLVRAAAAGVDISAAVSDLYVSPPYYRFNVMLQKAMSLTASVKSLGGMLLSALEKKDAEEVAKLRSSHELSLFEAVMGVRQQQVEEASVNLESISEGINIAFTRVKYYERLINEGLLTEEDKESTMLTNAMKFNLLSTSLNSLSGVLYSVPTAGGPVPKFEYGGMNLGAIARASADVASLGSQLYTYYANKNARMANQKRREDEWKQQLSLANLEYEQALKQSAGAGIRKAIAEKELSNHEKKIETSKEVNDWMHSKFSNEELYNWMVSQISGLYFQTYQLACDMAKKAQECYRKELAVPDASFIQFGYWDSLKKGLLAGESLQYDLERMDAAYIDNNKREFELSKQVSLSQLNPMALLALKENGSCTFVVPEVVFDLDHPGHYLRRIKSVGLSLPCIAGPYTSVGCSLTLTKHVTRRSADVDEELVADYISTQSIATSSAQNDRGMFEFNFRDERYLPFEGCGAVSEWELNLPSEVRQFDYDSISDVIMHVQYTARDGGSAFRDTVESNLLDQLNAVSEVLSENDVALVQTISIKSEFPNDWHRFLNPDDTATEQTVSISVDKTMFPYLIRDREISINSLDIMMLTDGEETSVLNISEITIDGNSSGELDLAANDSVMNGQLRGLLELSSSKKLTDQNMSISMIFSESDISGLAGQPEDIVIMVNYTL